MKHKCIPTEEKETCSTHTKEKEKSGTCCHEKEKQEEAEQETYEYTPCLLYTSPSTRDS